MMIRVLGAARRARPAAGAPVVVVRARMLCAQAQVPEVMKPTTSPVKASTNIPGYPVVPNAREVLVSLYDHTLQELKKLPEDAYYRKSTEAFTKWRREVVVKETDIGAIEKEIECGQIEELIEQAENELKVVDMMYEMKLYEVSADGPPVAYLRTHEAIPGLTPVPPPEWGMAGPRK